MFRIRDEGLGSGLGIGLKDRVTLLWLGLRFRVKDTVKGLVRFGFRRIGQKRMLQAIDT